MTAQSTENLRPNGQSAIKRFVRHPVWQRLQTPSIAAASAAFLVVAISGITVVGQERPLLSDPGPTGEVASADDRTIPAGLGSSEDAEAFALAPPFGGANIQVNQDFGGSQQNETSIAINPTDLNNLVGGANDYRPDNADADCGFYSSSDGGQTWVDGLLPRVDLDGLPGPEYTAAGDPAIAFDSAGNAYYLCMNFNRDGGGNGIQHTQFVRKSFDGGQTWGPPVETLGSPQANRDDKGHIAVDTGSTSPHHGNVYVVATRLNTGGLQFNRSTDGGNSFEGCPGVGACSDQAINDFANGFGGNIAVADDGTVYVAWIEDAGGGNAFLAFDRSTDGGASFTASDPIVRTFTPTDNFGGVDIRPHPRTNSFPVVQVDPTNPDMLYFVWTEDPAGNDDSDIMFRRCDVSGFPFPACDPVKRINDDVNPLPEFFSQFFPWMAVDPSDGSINIVWYDDRNDPVRTDGTPLVDLYFASSSDGGISFGPNLRVSDTSFDVSVGFGGGFFGDYNGIDADGGVAYPFWTDSRNGNQDVFTTAVGGADLAISKSAPGTISAGEELIYDITVFNTGPADAFNVTVTDTLPSGVSFVDDTDSCSGLGTLNCELGNIAAGDSVSFEIRVLVDVDVSSTNLTNEASVSSDQEDPDEANNTDTASTFVQHADLALNKSDSPDPVVAGAILTYTLMVSNGGPSSAVNVVVADDLPAGVSVVSVNGTGGASCNAGVPGNAALPTTCTFDSIASGDAETMTIVVTVLPGTTGLLQNDASVSSDTPDNNNANNLVTEMTTVQTEADLSVTKTDLPDPVVAGAGLTYVLNVSNNGPSVARAVVLTDTLPAAVTFSGAAIPGGSGVCAPLAGSPTVVSCELGDLDPGQAVMVFIDVVVDPSTPNGAILTNSASVSSSTTDTAPGNNTTDELTNVIAEADIWIDKTGNFATGNPSGTLLYFLTVHNVAGCSEDDPQVCGTGGPSDAQNIQVVDTLPSTSKKLIVEFVSERCSYDQSSHVVTCNELVLAAGASVTFEIQARAKGNLGDITNIVDVSSTTTDPDVGNNHDELLMTVQGGTGNPGGPGGGRGRGGGPN